MITLKSPKEIEPMARAGRSVAATLTLVRDDEGDLARVDDVDVIDWHDGKKRVYISGTY